MGFPKPRSTCFGGPQNKDSSILGSPPTLGDSARLATFAKTARIQVPQGTQVYKQYVHRAPKPVPKP